MARAALALALSARVLAQPSGLVGSPGGARPWEELSLLQLPAAAAVGSLEPPTAEPTEELVPLEVEFRDAPEAAVDGDLFAHIGSSSILLATVMLPNRFVDDRNAWWGDPAGGMVPRWVRKVFRNSLWHAQQHNHSFVVRTRASLKPLEHSCKDWRCEYKHEHSQGTWEKIRLLSDYLTKSPKHFSHILFLDADATLAQPDPTHDTLQLMAQDMDGRGASLLVPDEDWNAKYPKAWQPQVNTGTMMARNTELARRLFQLLLVERDMAFQPDTSRMDGGWVECRFMDQICFLSFLNNTEAEPGRQRPRVRAWGGKLGRDVVIVSGARYGASPCVLAPGKCSGNIPAEAYAPDIKAGQLGRVEIVHFMGQSKPKGNSWDGMFRGDVEEPPKPEPALLVVETTTTTMVLR